VVDHHRIQEQAETTAGWSVGFCVGDRDEGGLERFEG
jgi:hypothetical protein